MNTEITDELLKSIIMFNSTHYHTANIIYKLLPNEYKCVHVSTSRCVWYKKLDGEYKRLDHHTFEINILRNILIKCLELTKNTLHQPDPNDNDYKDKIEHYFSIKVKISHFEQKLYNQTFMRGVLKELEGLYFDSNY